jgi:hypothetical protein
MTDRSTTCQTPLGFGGNAFGRMRRFALTTPRSSDVDGGALEWESFSGARRRFFDELERQFDAKVEGDAIVHQAAAGVAISRLDELDDGSLAIEWTLTMPAGQFDGDGRIEVRGISLCGVERGIVRSQRVYWGGIDLNRTP